MPDGRASGRVNVLGVGVSPVNLTEALTTMQGWVARRERGYVCVTGVHGVMESQRDELLRQIHNRAPLVVPDGMPLVWLCRRAGYRQVDRVYGPELMLQCCEHARGAGGHFFYGGHPGVAERLAERLESRFPGLKVAGTYSPPFRALSEFESQEIIRLINEADPDYVWVGLSTPKQEHWMAANRAALRAPALIGVGAAFDFNAGLKRQAPRWMQRAGLEWLFRLLSEPRRLWRRYLINNPTFVWRVFLQATGVRRFSLSS
jgi:N-acetylglucosaminyldiphosphoundecaprenol N-acetyl-beta-D-mannosaminyltransferase